MDFEDKKNPKLNAEGEAERRVTEFNYSETSVMNNVDEDKENISECDMLMDDEAEDKGSCLPFQAVAHPTSNEQQPANEIGNETRLSQDKDDHLDQTKSPGCKQFNIEGRECEQQDNLIGN